ncbi:MAG: L,D-transpeptidase [Proteobacteria bacterium]|nr:L,D-transpeptidase [Pseudomonadota bacterium]
MNDPTVRAPLTAGLIVAALALAAPAQSQLRLDAYAIPEPTHADVDPGREEGSLDNVDPRFRRTPVFYRTQEPPGTVIVHTADRYLFLIQGNNRALRYGVGVGRDGFTWTGTHRITEKKEWPDWRPPPEMIERQPYLPRFMAGGPGNPLGARAMYLGKTVYRIHGTNAPETIGHAVSSGCIRLVNDDVIDLFQRINIGTKVRVLHH